MFTILRRSFIQEEKVSHFSLEGLAFELGRTSIDTYWFGPQKAASQFFCKAS